MLPKPSISVVSMREQMRGFCAIDVSVESARPYLIKSLARFGPVSEVPLKGIKSVVEFLAPVKSFTTRYAGIQVDDWSYLVTDMKGENCDVNGYALSRATGCRAICITILPNRRQLQIIESGKIEREVQSLQDGDRWYFRESGPLQPFEDASDYVQKQKDARLSEESLAKYFERYTGQKLPEWSTLTENAAIGLRRSTKDVRVKIDVYATDTNLGGAEGEFWGCRRGSTLDT